jgi:hypothetical protein
VGEKRETPLDGFLRRRTALVNQGAQMAQNWPRKFCRVRDISIHPGVWVHRHNDLQNGKYLRSDKHFILPPQA